MSVVNKLKNTLDIEMYRRKDPNEVLLAFQRLRVQVSKAVEEFFANFEGPFWEETIGMEFLDMVEDEINIESETIKCRSVHLFPINYLVLTEMVANEVIVLDTLDDKVYRVNFEGGSDKLLKGELEADWLCFEDFLVAYFGV